MHWLTSSAGITGTGEVDIFYSLSSRLLSTPLCRQLADIYRLLADDDGVIKVTIKPVQQQRLQQLGRQLWSLQLRLLPVSVTVLTPLPSRFLRVPFALVYITHSSRGKSNPSSTQQVHMGAGLCSTMHIYHYGSSCTATLLWLVGRR